MNKKKYVYLHVIQGKYGWEDVTQDENYQVARALLKDYNENEPATPHRLISRRVPSSTMGFQIP